MCPVALATASRLRPHRLCPAAVATAFRLRPRLRLTGPGLPPLACKRSSPKWWPKRARPKHHGVHHFKWLAYRWVKRGQRGSAQGDNHKNAALVISRVFCRPAWPCVAGCGSWRGGNPPRAGSPWYLVPPFALRCVRPLSNTWGTHWVQLALLGTPVPWVLTPALRLHGFMGAAGALCGRPTPPSPSPPLHGVPNCEAVAKGSSLLPTQAA